MRRLRVTGLLVLLSTVLVLSYSLASPSPVAGGPPTVWVLVSFQQPPGPEEEELIRSLGGVVRHTYEIVPTIAAEMPRNKLDELAADPRVTSVEEDGRVQALSEEYPWGVVRIGADLIHPQNRGTGVKVAILDSGIDLDHEDLAVAGDVTFVDGTTSGDDDNGHGTKIAGVVAALINDIGVVGVAPEAELHAVKVMDQGGWVYWSDAIKGIDWAWKNDVQVVNMSFGGPNEPPDAVHRAIIKAHRKGVILVAGAGNLGDEGFPDLVFYPAKYDEVIAVGATDETDTRVSTSSWGPSLELVAPGANIYTTTIGGYGYGGGTSISTPHVVGAAALVIASGITDPDEVRQRLQDTAYDLGDPGRDEEYGYGLVDAYAAATP